MTQTSSLFAKRDRGFEPGTTEKQIPLATGRMPRTRDYNTSARPKPLGHAASQVRRTTTTTTKKKSAETTVTFFCVPSFE